MDELFAVGESKFGGWPDLPRNMPWPTGTLANSDDGYVDDDDNGDDDESE